jgi:hypothetical protein
MISENEMDTDGEYATVSSSEVSVNISNRPPATPTLAPPAPPPPPPPINHSKPITDIINKNRLQAKEKLSAPQSASFVVSAFDLQNIKLRKQDQTTRPEVLSVRYSITNFQGIRVT